MNSSTIISKVWNFCNTLRDDGVSYGDYLEQLTYLLFLKLADEFSKPPYNRSLPIPKEYNWESLTLLKGADLDNLPDPDILAAEIIENLEAGLENFRKILNTLNNNK